LEILERRFRKDAVFEDPWCKCTGYKEYASKFYALPRINSSCERLHCRILAASFAPNKLVFSQTQECTLRWVGTKKNITSFAHVDLDDEFKIVHMADQWNGAELPTRWGMLRLRKMNGKLASWLFRVPNSGSPN